MKNKILIIILTFISFGSYAQLDRSKKPAPDPAPEINLGEFETFTLSNGLKVFVVENHKLPRVAFSLILDRDPILEGENAGYISIAGQLLRNGTTNRPKSQLDEEIDFIGASLSTSSTGVYAASLKKHADKLVEIMADVVKNPAFPESEFEKIKKQTLSGLAAQKDDPEAIASNVSQVLTYGKDHPYGEIITEETVENISLQQIKEYYATYFKPNIAYLAVVGDINKKEAEQLVEKYFGDWEKGDVPTHEYELPKAPENTVVALVDRPQSVQSVIEIAYPIELKPGDAKVIKSAVMNNILGGSFSSRLNMNLREAHGYTYGARSSISSDELIGNFSASASVRNEVTDSAVAEFLHELKNIKSQSVKEEELGNVKNYLTGSFARSLESPQTIANFALNVERYDLPDDYYAKYLKNIADVGLDDVQQMAENFIMPEQAYIIVVGKASEVAEGLKSFGEVKYFDIYGNEETPSATSAIPVGLTAEQVVEDYFAALGGRENLSRIKDLKISSTASLMGQELNITIAKKSPDKSFMVISSGGNEMQKEVINGDQVAVYQMGNAMPMDDETAAEAKVTAGFVPELYYDKNAVTTELTGIEKIDGQETYAVEIKLPSGKSVTHYYSTVSGLKLRETQTIETPQGAMVLSTDYTDYKEVDGIKFPHTTLIPIPGMPQKLRAEVDTIEVNAGVEDEIFKVNE